MIRIYVNILILTLAASTDLENVQYDNTTSEIIPYSVITTSGYAFVEDPENRAFKSEDGITSPGNSTTIKNETSELKYLNLKPFFNEVRICRKSYANYTNLTFRRSLFCFLLASQNEIKTEPDFYCNITKSTIDDLKGKLEKIPFFQNISELNIKHNFCGHSRLKKRSEDYQKYVTVEDNLKLKLGDEWILPEHKIPHISHIYLGTSKFPILTQESRILDKDTGFLRSSSTQKSFLEETTTDKKHVPEAITFEDIYRWLKPYRWEKNHSQVSKEQLKQKKRSLNSDSDLSSEFVNPFNSAFMNSFYSVYISDINATDISESPKSKNLIQKGMSYLRSAFLKFLNRPI